jgi:ABC-type multidrug transport system permease subunit
VRTILLLGHHEVRLFLRDRSSWIWLFLVPLVFVLAMGMAIRGPGGPADARPTVLVDNRDEGFLGRIFVEELGQQGLDLVRPSQRDDVKRGITVPADFSERLLAKQAVSVDLFVTEGGEIGNDEIARLRLWRALIAMNARLARHAMDHSGAPPTEAAMKALLARPPSVVVKASHAGRKPTPVRFNFSLPGNLVGYLFLNLLIFGGASVAAGRRNGVLARLAVNPVRRSELLFGKIYGLVLLGGTQVAFLVLVGQFALGVDMAENLPGILLTLLIFCWVAASCGVLLGFLVKAEDKVIGLSLAVALPSAAVGGCWFPMDTAPPLLGVCARLVPTSWAMDAMHQFITFGAGLEKAWPAVGVLVLFGLAANLAAARFFRV